MGKKAQKGKAKAKATAKTKAKAKAKAKTTRRTLLDAGHPAGPASSAAKKRPSAKEHKIGSHVADENNLVSAAQIADGKFVTDKLRKFDKNRMPSQHWRLGAPLAQPDWPSKVAFVASGLTQVDASELVLATAPAWGLRSLVCALS